MKRRAFVKASLLFPTAYLATKLGGCGTSATSRVQARSDDVRHIQSYGYYQGLGPDEERSPSRDDGTDYNMPCIPAEDIERAERKEYVFWHGHGGQDHRFAVEAEHFEALQAGEDVEIYTDVIQGHRHALLLTSDRPCGNGVQASVASRSVSCRV